MRRVGLRWALIVDREGDVVQLGTNAAPPVDFLREPR